MNEKSNPSFWEELKNLFVSYYDKNLIYNSKSYSVEREIFIQCLSLLNVSIIKYWIESEYKYSVEEISLFVANAFFNKPLSLLSISCNNLLNESRNQDRRVKKTRNIIEKSFLSLLKAKDYATISITDIATKADITRATFYKHYKNKDDLLNHILKQISTKVIHAFHEANRSGDNSMSPENFTEIFSYVKSQRDVIQLLKNYRKLPQIKLILFHNIKQYFIHLIGEDPVIEEEIFANYISGILIRMIFYCMDNNFKYPPQYLGEQLYRYIYKKPMYSVYI